ncbi:hypothetical protein CLAIMM_14845 [Cladophialophora immunda]|nr:hypothetical protein CLAIMM_14845 [Cladophialophora immunda]
MDNFQHQRLDSNSDSIRLLKLEPAKFGVDEVRCRLFHTTLSRCPTYYALSYTWGSKRDERHIFVDGSRCKVRANLWSFLKQAQETLPSSMLWIDALCIDQHSNEERGHQVQLMSGIYGRAEKVILWLGNDGVAISYLFWTFADSAEDLSHLTEEDLQTYIRTLYMLTQFPYWSRMWIAQELLLASTVELMYNDDLLPWDRFRTGVDSLLRICGERDVPGTKRFSITHSYAYRHREQRDVFKQLPEGSKSADLNGLLIRYSSSQCTLIRDRVVGLLSLVERGDSFKNCYDGTAANLVLRAFLHFRGNLELLGRLRQCLRVTHAGLYEELACWQPSRISSTYTDPSLYRGEMVRFEAGHGYAQSGTGVRCLTCNATIVRMAQEPLLRSSLHCLAGMGTSCHMFCAADFSDDGQISSYAIFFDKPNGHEKHKFAKFRPRSQGLMAIMSEQPQRAWHYISIDLFVYLVEYLRLPEEDWTAPVPPTKTLMPVPKSANPSTRQSWTDARFPLSKDPIGHGTLNLIEVDLLVPAKDGRSLEEWFEFRKARPKFREYLSGQ